MLMNHCAFGCIICNHKMVWLQYSILLYMLGLSMFSRNYMFARMNLPFRRICLSYWSPARAPCMKIRAHLLSASWLHLPFAPTELVVGRLQTLAVEILAPAVEVIRKLGLQFLKLQPSLWPKTRIYIYIYTSSQAFIVEIIRKLCMRYQYQGFKWLHGSELTGLTKYWYNNISLDTSTIPFIFIVNIFFNIVSGTNWCTAWQLVPYLLICYQSW